MNCCFPAEHQIVHQCDGLIQGLQRGDAAEMILVSVSMCLRRLSQHLGLFFLCNIWLHAAKQHHSWQIAFMKGAINLLPTQAFPI